jgi:hypothetical protein
VGGGSYPFANSGGAFQTGFTGQNNIAGGGFGTPEYGSQMQRARQDFQNQRILDPQGVYSDTFKGAGAPAQDIARTLSEMLAGRINEFNPASGGGSVADRRFPSFAEQARTQQQLAGQQKFATGGLSALAQGGMSNLGDYSDGGRLLRGPGDGISDSIPAMIGKKQPARLADGEFVVPARIVSELGNGSTEAGARKLYAMMDRVQKARGKTVGKGKVAANSRSAKYLPA